MKENARKCGQVRRAEISTWIGWSQTTKTGFVFLFNVRPVIVDLALLKLQNSLKFLDPFCPFSTNAFLAMMININASSATNSHKPFISISFPFSPTPVLFADP